MFDEETLNKVKEVEEEWNSKFAETYEKKLKFKLPQYYTESGIPVKPVYTPQDIKHIAYRDIEMPGSYPYTRGVYPLTYQYNPWMTQQLHGYGLPEHTRERIDALIREGMAGYGERPVLLIEIDLASTYGYDPDDRHARGMVATTGVSLCKEEDLDVILKGFDLSMTRVAISTKITCLPMLALYLAYAEKRGYKPNQLNGQSQNRPKFSWLGENVRGYPPKDQLKLQIELIKYCTEHMPGWNHTNLCGYIPGENFATPAQEMGLVLAEAIELVESGIRAGLNPDDFVPRFSAQFHLGMDFFEEIGKLRAYRRMWAKTMKERFNCKNPRSHQFRFHVHTGGVNLTGQQPLNNVARTTLQVLAAVLGGTQSLHTTSYDEAIALPSEEAVTTALRVNQIVQHETRVTNVSDPLGGSYYVEWLTDKLEEEAWRVVEEIESRGGFVKCMENGWIWQLFDKQIRNWRQEVDEGKRVIVGVNRYQQEEKLEIPVFTIAQEEMQKVAVERVKNWKENRDKEAVKNALKRVEEAARSYQSVEQAGSLMPALIDAAKARCTVGELTNVLFDVYGCVYPY